MDLIKYLQMAKMILYCAQEDVVQKRMYRIRGGAEGNIEKCDIIDGIQEVRGVDWEARGSAAVKEPRVAKKEQSTAHRTS